MTTPKKEPWRIIGGIAAIIYIVFLWVKKDIAAIYASMPPEQAAPMILTTLAVSLVKVIVLTGGILLLKWLLTKFQEKRKYD